MSLSPASPEEARPGAERSVWRAMARGALGHCPRCGVGPLFAGYTQVAERCGHCGEDLHHQRADDAPPYIVMMLVGHLVVGLALSVEVAFHPSLALHLALWLPLTLVLSLALLRPVKGAIVGLQWANRMHGFGDAGS